MIALATPIPTKAWEFYQAICEIDRCNKAIQQYAELGMSGTPHDLEHHGMRSLAKAKAERLRREIKI